MTVFRPFRYLWLICSILAFIFVARTTFAEVTMSRVDSLRLEHERARRPLPSHRVLMSTLDSLRLSQAISARPEMDREQVLDRTIEPEKYVVGPGDELILILWGEISESFLLEITPEGNVLVPHVGEILVRQLTLAQAKDRIIREVGKRYRNVNISVSLTKVR